MEETVSSVFLAGRERYARMRRIGLFVIAGALAAHLTLFLGYTRTLQDAEEAKRQSAALDGTREATTGLMETVGEFTASLEPKPVLDRLLTNVRGDFGHLSGWLPEGKLPPRPEPDTLQGVPNMAAQRPPRTGGERAAHEPAEGLESALLRRLRGMADDERNRLRSAHVDEYRARMDALIDESIVRPRFEEANAAWRDHVERNVRPSAAAVRKQAAALTAADPRAAQIAPTVDKAVAAAEAIRFAPPPGNTWWQTVNAKMEAIAEIADNAAEKMVAGRHTADLTADLEADAARAEHDAEALVAALAAKKKELEDQAKNAFASLSMLAKPLEFIAVEAETVVRWYPLVIGIALAIAAWFGTEARRGYLAALAFVEHAMPEDAAWKRVVERSRASLRPTRSPWIPWLAAAVVWCGAAAWRLVSLDSQTMARAPGAAAAGVALVAAAVAHRVWTERRAERGGVTAT